jgi:hypothetical protein
MTSGAEAPRRWTLKILVVLATAAVLAPAADNVSLTGQWTIHRSAGGKESTQSCTFTQNDDELGGTCTSDKGPIKASGKIDGKKVTWTVKTERDGNPLTIVYNGTVESASKITGTVTAVEFGIDGDFTATRSK